MIVLSHKEDLSPIMNNHTDLVQKILTCLTSSEDFKLNAKYVKDELNKQDRNTISVFLDTIEGFITDESSSPEFRFYSLLFLKVTTERYNRLLISQLTNRHNLLKALEQQAAYDKDKQFPERGSTFFRSNPTEKEKYSGSNYLALLLEIINYWNQKYVSKEGKINVFGSMFKILSEDLEVPFPSSLRFYKSKNQGAENGAIEDSTSFQLQTTEQPFSRKQDARELNKQMPEVDANAKEPETHDAEIMNSSLEKITNDKPLSQYHPHLRIPILEKDVNAEMSNSLKIRTNSENEASLGQKNTTTEENITRSAFQFQKFAPEELLLIEEEKQEEQKTQRSTRSQQTSKYMKLSSEAKLAERSLKFIRNCDGDLRKIQSGIERSFALSQKKFPPVYSERLLINHNTLSVVYQELNLLRSENEALRNSSSLGVSTTSEKNELKPLVSQLQHQIMGFKKEIEQLKQKNKQLEQICSKDQRESLQQLSKNKTPELETENNKNSPKHSEAQSSVNQQSEDNKILNKKIKELSSANEKLTTAMEQLKRENYSLLSKIGEYEYLLSSGHKPEDKQSTININHDAKHENSIKSDLTQKKAVVSQMSPVQFNWITLNKSLENNLTKYGATYGSDQEQKFSENRHIFSNSNTAIVNNEIEKMQIKITDELQNERHNYKNSEHPHITEDINDSRSVSSANEGFETPNEDLSGTSELLEVISKELVSPKFHFFGRENHKAVQGDYKFENQQPHHFFSALRNIKLEGVENDNEHVKDIALELTSESKRYDQEWAKRFSKKQ